MNNEEQIDPLEDDDMLPDYGDCLKNGVRGKYAGRIQRRSNLAVLAPDVAEAFPTDRAVNDALRSLLARGAEEPAPEPSK